LSSEIVVGNLFTQTTIGNQFVFLPRRTEFLEELMFIIFVMGVA